MWPSRNRRHSGPASYSTRWSPMSPCTRPQSTAIRPIKDRGMDLTFGIEVECYVSTHVLLAHNTVRTYLQGAFERAGLSTTESQDPKEGHTYENWLITRDGSLTESFEHHRLAQILPQLYEETQGKYTPAEGVELVSRPMSVPSVASQIRPDQQAQMTEIRRYMHVLGGKVRNRGKHAAFASSDCGLHVHFGRPDGSPLPLNLLRHLAYLTVLYEPIINSLHIFWRTPHPETHAREFCNSNRIGFQRNEHTCFNYQQCLVPILEIRRRIFDPKRNLRSLAGIMGTDFPVCPLDHPLWVGDHCDRCEQVAAGVCLNGCSRESPNPCPECPWNRVSTPLVSHKYKIVNWAPLIAEDRPHTIEFRQPAGTVDAEEIGWTVQLYTALIREAERRANDEVSGKSPPLETEIPTDLQQFLATLRLTDAAKAYWTARQRRYAICAARAGRGEEQLKRTDVCLECAMEESQRMWQSSGAYEAMVQDRVEDEMYTDWTRRQEEQVLLENMWPAPEQVSEVSEAQAAMERQPRVLEHGWHPTSI